ncbi:MAG: hypothetical protein ACI8U4_001694 [Natronomonas sp.]|jgi:uncharacterized protein (DUF302 family)
MGKNLYQNVRTQVKRNLRPILTGPLGMDFAIRATTPVSVPETKDALESYLGNAGFHVIHETDVKAIHNHYEIEYPDFRILKVVNAETFMECPMASSAVSLDPGTSSLLPPGIAIYDLDGTTHVSAVRPSTLLAVFRDPDVRETIIELEGALWDALENGVPQATLPEQEPPVTPDEGADRARMKKRLNLVLSLVDAEYAIHVSSPHSPHEVKEQLRPALTKRGQRVVGEVADGQILLVVNPGQAHKALALDPDVAVFAPLSVSVMEHEGRTHVRSVRPSTLLIFFGQPAMQDVLLEMEMLLWNGITRGVPDVRVESRQPPLQPEGGQRNTAGGLPGGLGSAMRRPSD